MPADRLTRAEVAAELQTLRKVKACCVELVKMLETIASADPNDEGDAEWDTAIDLFWAAEERICRRVMTLLPEEFCDRQYRGSDQR